MQKDEQHVQTNCKYPSAFSELWSGIVVLKNDKVEPKDQESILPSLLIEELKKDRTYWTRI